MGVEDLKPSFSLCEIANWQRFCKKTDVTVVVPRLQRGLVWNAARIEVFWDSLMRKIPVGVFCLSDVSDDMRKQLKEEIPPNVERCYFLLDGQQRANAITLGYHSFTYGTEEDLKPILWIDLLPTFKDPRCKFEFYVTTVAHPWGFASRTKDRETNSVRLSSCEMRRCVEKFKGAEFVKNYPAWRPPPSELYPLKASNPIPVSFLLEAANICKHYDDFWAIVLDLVCSAKETYWYKENYNKVNDFITSTDCQRQREILKNAIINLNDTKIPTLYMPHELARSPDDVSLFFDRMNTQGVVPGPEERAYSMAKSFWPELWNIEKFAKNRMLPFRMAILALETFLILKDRKWHSSDVSAGDIRKIAENNKDRDEFSRFIESENGIFYRLCEKVDKWMGLSEYEEELPVWALLRFHRTLIAHKSKRLYKLLLLLAQMDAENVLIARDMAGFITFSRWFVSASKEDGLAKVVYESCVKTPDMLLQGIKRGLATAVNQEIVSIPPTPDELKIILELPAQENKGYWESVSEQYVLPKWSSIVKIKKGFGNEVGAELLLYAVRDYMKMFNYDPAEHEKWESYNRPWDYDHILPQNWLGNRGRGGCGPWMAACRDMLETIGNSAPIPFGLNRSKNDDPPGSDYCNRDPNLFISYESIGQYNNQSYLDRDETRAKQFIDTTNLRFFNLYKEWFEKLRIGELITIASDDYPPRIGNRKKIFEAVNQRLLGKAKFFYVARGFQFECTTSIDWCLPWLAVGIVRDDRSDFVCVVSNGIDVYLGRRRHPKSRSIDNSPDTWWYEEPKKFLVDDCNVDQICIDLTNLC